MSSSTRPGCAARPLAATLLSVFCFAIGVLPDLCRAEQPAPVMDELIVNGERAGPGMWHVRNGSSQLWILGSMSPLPRGITWRSKQVETVLQTTSQVLVQKPFEIGVARILWLLLTERSSLMVHGGKRLADVMPPQLHARFAAQRDKYTDDPKKWERYRPLIAAAFLTQAAYHQVGLSARLDLGAAMRILAKKHGVRIEEIQTAGVGDVMQALKSMPPAAENACVEASLVTIEKGLNRLVDRAQAWANGNVELIEHSTSAAEVDSCRAALDTAKGASDLIVQLRQSWLAAMDKYLQSGATSIAVVNMDLLLEHGGLLEQLKSKGYEIIAP
jgi:uncharacterized protein YbaP (TraB family)